MAYHEIRLMCTKLFYNFDVTLDPESENWTDQKNYILWYVSLIPIKFLFRR